MILPEDLVPPPGFKPIPIIPNRIERRTLERVDVVVVMSEKNATVQSAETKGSMNSEQNLKLERFITLGSTSEKLKKPENSLTKKNTEITLERVWLDLLFHTLLILSRN